MNIKSYIMIAAAGLMFAGCEDALDRYPKDKLTPDTFFTNANECELFTNDFYTIFPDGSGIYGESADVISIRNLTSEVLGNRTIPATSGSWTWTKLRDINFFLEHSVNCADIQVREKYQALARFFRAYFYFEKMKRYGDVPWVDRAMASDDAELYKGRDSRQFITGKIIDDLNFAIDHLDAKRDVYRVTRWTALALKSRVSLFEGTFRKYHGLGDYEGLLKDCVTASQQFIKESGYIINNASTQAYRDLFANISADGSEIVLARAYNTSIGLSHDVNGYLTSTTMGHAGMLKNIANMYLMTDGTPFTSQPGWDIMTLPQESKNRDRRFAQTVRTPGYTRINSTKPEAPNLAVTETGYHLTKYLTEAKYDSYKASTSDLPLFRAAEVYLNYAEAKAELGTLTQADLDLSIKPLRTRAGVAALMMDQANANPDSYLADAETGYANVSGANKGVILEIRRERTVELIMENLRYWDIMRWKEGKRFTRPFTGLYFPGPGEYDLNEDGTPDVCLWTGAKPDTKCKIVYELDVDIKLTDGTSGNILLHTDYPRTWNEDRDYLYPIPTDDRVITQGSISQNPGWDDKLKF